MSLETCLRFSLGLVWDRSPLNILLLRSLTRFASGLAASLSQKLGENQIRAFRPHDAAFENVPLPITINFHATAA